ncbi:hypothetical protein K4F52_005945 [Lecanicillium sp. MT-2017a]|nr:hypothetical protein K4F52_005945 [Lecanicillium sp. MT-2017a]
MSDPPPRAVVGCLLDVSGSMRSALEAGRSDEDAIERLRAVLRAALKLAQAEQRHTHDSETAPPDPLFFVGIFGLAASEEHPYPPAVDLCGLTDVLVADSGDHRSGHDVLINRANENDVSYVSEYIRRKLSDREARIVNAHLKLHPEKVTEFVNAIPAEIMVHTLRSTAQIVGSSVGNCAKLGDSVLSTTLGPAGSALARGLGINDGDATGRRFAEQIEDLGVDSSEALAMARRIQKEWLWDFTDFVPRPVSEVVNILQRLQDHDDYHSNVQENVNDNQLDILRQYLYGRTPMCHALRLAQKVFRNKSNAARRVLVLVSDGNSTDGDPTPAAFELRDEGVSIATVYLTENQSIVQRALYYKAASTWAKGPRTLFQLSSRVAGATHPIPVLASAGWTVPSAGEIALFSMVRSAAALDEFCSLLLSARFGSADALLDIIGRIHFDDYINKEQTGVRKKPSDQQNEAVCYAHATASVVHMALLRIVSRDGGIPTLDEIRTKIKDKFPERPEGHPIDKVLQAACDSYRPIRFRAVDEDGARQAVLRRRPVLAGFRLTDAGWDNFCEHFDEHSQTRTSVLTQAQMAPYRSLKDDGGHAVVLVGCSPNSLTFLNSWGSSWGDNGSFSVDKHTALGRDGAAVEFYDVYWLESELTNAERQAYNTKVDEELRRRADEHPSVFELEYRCPKCKKNAPLAEFRGNIRRASCPKCEESFETEAGHLTQALYLRAGLSDIV